MDPKKKWTLTRSEIVLVLFVGLFVLFGSLALMAGFLCLVVAKQQNAQAVPEILTTTGILGLIAGVCVNYAPNLEKKERELVVRSAEEFLMACMCLIFGLLIKYGTEALGGIGYVKESADFTKWIGKNGMLFVNMAFIFATILAIAGARDLTSHLFRRLRMSEAFSPVIKRIVLWTLSSVILLFVMRMTMLAVAHIWKHFFG